MPNPENLKPFKKGADARRAPGRPKGSHNISTVLNKMLKKVAPDLIVNKKFVQEYTRGKARVSIADALACRLLFEAINEGNVSAMKEINDRTEGKAAQSIEHTGEGGKPLIPDGPAVVVYLPDNGRGDGDDAVSLIPADERPADDPKPA